MNEPTRKTCPLCQKQITLRKDGTFRLHRSNIPEFPGSIWNKVCRGERPE